MNEQQTEMPATEEDRHLAMLRGVVDGFLAEEGILPHILESVDLGIAYSPVLAFRGEGLRDAAKVTKTMGGNYLVDHPMVKHGVTPDALRVMRCRWLLARDKEAAQFGPLAHILRAKRAQAEAQ